MTPRTPLRAVRARLRAVRARLRAFTLLEILATLAIVAILATLAVGSHGRFLLTARRYDARAALVALAAAQERHRLAHGRYAAAFANPRNPASGGADNPSTRESTDDSLSFAATSPEGWYELRILAGDEQRYALEARARGAQRRDGACARFTLDDTGGRGAYAVEGTETTADCWN